MHENLYREFEAVVTDTTTGIDLLIIGKGISSRAEMPSSLAAAVYESIVAAIYLDGGFEAAKTFYKSVDGWTTQDIDGTGGKYTILNAGGVGIGGLMQMPEEARKNGARPAWVGYVHVDDVDAKADALAVLTAAGAPSQALQVVPGGPPWFHPGRSGTIQIGPQNILGHFGELHPSALEALDAEGPLVAFEVILERIPEPKAKATRAKPVLDLSPFQPVERDFAFVVEHSVKAADVVRAAAGVDRKLITGVSVFDVYEGTGIAPGKKSIAIAVTMQPRERTMTDAEIEALAAKIVAEVGKRTGGVLRT